MTSIVTIKVIQPGDRAEELLARVADAVQIEPSRKVSPELAQFWFSEVDANEAEAALLAALDNTGTDWDDHLVLRPGEKRRWGLPPA